MAKKQDNITKPNRRDSDLGLMINKKLDRVAIFRESTGEIVESFSKAIPTLFIERYFDERVSREHFENLAKLMEPVEYKG